MLCRVRWPWGHITRNPLLLGDYYHTQRICCEKLLQSFQRPKSVSLTFEECSLSVAPAESPGYEPSGSQETLRHSQTLSVLAVGIASDCGLGVEGGEDVWMESLQDTYVCTVWRQTFAVQIFRGSGSNNISWVMKPASFKHAPAKFYEPQFLKNCDNLVLYCNPSHGFCLCTYNYRQILPLSPGLPPRLKVWGGLGTRLGKYCVNYKCSFS